MICRSGTQARTRPDNPDSSFRPLFSTRGTDLTPNEGATNLPEFVHSERARGESRALDTKDIAAEEYAMVLGSHHYAIHAFRTDRPDPEELRGAPEAGTMFYPCLPVGGNAVVTVMTQHELDAITYQPSLVYDNRLQRLLPSVQERLGILREIQRPVAGAKARNIPRYAQYQVELAR